MGAGTVDREALKAELRKELIAEQQAAAAASMAIGQAAAPHPGGTAMHDAQHGKKTIKVRVTVAGRAIPNSPNGEKFPGMGCAHIFWPNGVSEQMVTERQYADLQKFAADEPGFQLQNVGEMEAKMRAEVEAQIRYENAATEAAKVGGEQKPAPQDPKKK